MDTALKVLKEISKHGFKAYIVGGFVRDFILGVDTNDIDICTDATPKDIKNIFNNVDLPNDSYSAVRLYIKRYTFDIMTFRKEISYYNNRKPQEVEYIKDLKEDLLRRDFTMNSICMDKDGIILDLLDAQKDIENRVIKAIGNPITKFMEDPLRILRAVRFYSTLDFELDEETKAGIIQTKKELSRLSYSRKKDELDKIFNSTNSKRGVNLIIELGLDKELELDFSKCYLDTDLIGIWATIDTSANYPFTKNEKHLISEIKEALKTDILSNINLYKYGLYISTIVGSIKGIDRSIIIKKFKELPIVSRKDIDISANQIMGILEIEPSKIINEIYEQLIKEILCGKLENNYEEISKYLINNYK